MYWADELAASVDGPQVVNDSKTPSGTVHVGSLRGPVILDVITRALRDRGVPTTLLYGVDDMDPMDAQALLTPDAVEREMGRPLSRVADQVGDCHRLLRAPPRPDLHRHLRRSRHPSRSLLLDERHLPDRRAGPVHPDRPRSGGDRPGPVPARLQGGAPGRLAPDQRRLPDLRQGRDDARPRLGRRDGRLRVPARLRHLGQRLRDDRSDRAVRRAPRSCPGTWSGPPSGRSSG